MADTFRISRSLALALLVAVTACFGVMLGLLGRALGYASPWFKQVTGLTAS